jgi:hypothetical protein
VQGWLGVVLGKTVERLCACALLHGSCFLDLGGGVGTSEWLDESSVGSGVFPLYFFSTLTFWLSQERPSKMPGGSLC